MRISFRSCWRDGMQSSGVAQAAASHWRAESRTLPADGPCLRAVIDSPSSLFSPRQGASACRVEGAFTPGPERLGECSRPRAIQSAGPVPRGRCRSRLVRCRSAAARDRSPASRPTGGSALGLPRPRRHSGPRRLDRAILDFPGGGKLNDAAPYGGCVHAGAGLHIAGSLRACAQAPASGSAQSRSGKTRPKTSPLEGPAHARVPALKPHCCRTACPGRAARGVTRAVARPGVGGHARLGRSMAVPFGVDSPFSS